MICFVKHHLFAVFLEDGVLQGQAHVQLVKPLLEDMPNLVLFSPFELRDVAVLAV